MSPVSSALNQRQFADRDLLQRRGGVRYEDYLYQQASSAEAPALQQRSSSFFQTPHTHLDPRLFIEGDRLKPLIRQGLLNALYGMWRTRYSKPEVWSTAWIAGSAITALWGADDVGDLDVLIGVNFPLFFEANREYIGIGKTAMTEQFNRELKDELWSRMEDWHGFEVTFYVNPGSADIRDIKPYAAYNLNEDRWDVEPIEVEPDWDPSSQLPQEWWRRVEAETQKADEILAQYDRLHAEVQAMGPDTYGPRWLNKMTEMRHTVDQGAALFDVIHQRRKEAFTASGQGFHDFANFAWQAGKRSGSVPALKRLKDLRRGARTETNVEKYGTELPESKDVLTEAAMWYRKKIRQ